MYLLFIAHYYFRLTSANQIRSGLRYSAWDNDVARVIRIDVDASDLLQNSIKQEHNRGYADLASPEFTPTSLSPPPATPQLPLRKPFSKNSTTHTLGKVSRRLEALSNPASRPILCDFVYQCNSSRAPLDSQEKHLKEVQESGQKGGQGRVYQPTEGAVQNSLLDIYQIRSTEDDQGRVCGDCTYHSSAR